MATTAQVRTAKEVGQRRLSVSRVIDIGALVLLSLGALLMVMPFLWMFSTSLRSSSESFKLPPAWLPTQFHWENYSAVFSSSVPFLAFAWNSIKVTFAV